MARYVVLFVAATILVIVWPSAAIFLLALWMGLELLNLLTLVALWFSARLRVRADRRRAAQ